MMVLMTNVNIPKGKPICITLFVFCIFLFLHSFANQETFKRVKQQIKAR